MLSDRDRQRYARQILLPEVGMAGQRTLLATRAHLPKAANRAASAVARAYLERAGVAVTGEERDPTDPSVVPVPGDAAVHRCAASGELIHAAAALQGALAAVETIKSALAVGTPMGTTHIDVPPLSHQHPSPATDDNGTR